MTRPWALGYTLRSAPKTRHLGPGLHDGGPTPAEKRIFPGYDCSFPGTGSLLRRHLMRVMRFGDDVVAWAPAKVNLFLEVLGKRPDGYHDIATLMVAVRLFDTLVFRQRSSGEIDLRCNRRDLPAGPDNLVVRVAKLLKERTGFPGGASIRLVKRIPMQAGLAGGSTDAAATLASLNVLWQLGLPDSELANLGGQLGSDVPFFVQTTAAWCTGRGEKVTPARLGRPLDFVVCCPPVGVVTAEAYRKVQVPTKPASGEEVRQALEKGDVEEIGRHLNNRLQEVSESLCPAVAECRQRLTRFKPAGVLMSGSGSSVFALCRDRSEAQRIAQEVQRGIEGAVFVVRTC